MTPMRSVIGESSPDFRFRRLCSSMPVNPYTRMREAGDYRRVVLESGLAHVVDSSESAQSLPQSYYRRSHQIILPYFGVFSFTVGSRQWLFDANRTLFTSPGWEYCGGHPVAGVGHSVLILTPTPDVLEEICFGRGQDRSTPFMSVSMQSTMRLRLLAHHLLHRDIGSREPLWIDEWIVRTLQEALSASPTRGPGASNVVNRAKEILHARGCERISLTDVAKTVGVSPVYLTQEFTRREGVPLYRYHLGLRLSRALLELPDCADITALSLDLGFSSHSHFTSVFRNHFGITPSQYRISASDTAKVADLLRM